jgi:hypothetical protein
VVHNFSIISLSRWCFHYEPPEVKTAQLFDEVGDSFIISQYNSKAAQLWHTAGDGFIMSQ